MATVPAPGTLPGPGAGRIQVWWSRFEPGTLTDAQRAGLAADLDAATLARAERYVRAADRDRALAGHALLRRLLVAVLGGRPADLELGKRCGHCGSTEHGKPYPRGGSDAVEVNLSHSGPVVCVALGGPGAGVGIDAEERRGVNWAALRSAVFADSEWAVTEGAPEPDRRRTDAWARKEAAVKSCGWGLSMPLHAVVVTPAGSAWSAQLTDGMGIAVGRDLALGPDMAAAVALHRPDGDPTPPAVSVRAVDLV